MIPVSAFPGLAAAAPSPPVGAASAIPLEGADVEGVVFTELLTALFGAGESGPPAETQPSEGLLEDASPAPLSVDEVPPALVAGLSVRVSQVSPADPDSGDGAANEASRTLPADLVVPSAPVFNPADARAVFDAPADTEGGPPALTRSPVPPTAPFVRLDLEPMPRAGSASDDAGAGDDEGVYDPRAFRPVSGAVRETVTQPVGNRPHTPMMLSPEESDAKPIFDPERSPAPQIRTTADSRSLRIPDSAPEREPLVTGPAARPPTPGKVSVEAAAAVAPHSLQQVTHRVSGEDQPPVSDEAGAEVTGTLRPVMVAAGSHLRTPGSPLITSPAATAAPAVVSASPNSGTVTSQVVTVPLGAGANHAARLRVSVRGDLVHATIVTDAATAGSLARNISELHQSLRDRGFRDSTVIVRSPIAEPARIDAAETRSEPADRERSAEHQPDHQRSARDDSRHARSRHPAPEEET